MSKPSAKSKSKTKAAKKPTSVVVQAEAPPAAVAAQEPARPSKEAVRGMPKLASSWQIARRATGVLRKNWKLFLGITLIQLLLNLFLVRGFSGISDIYTLETILESELGRVVGGLGSYLVLFSSSGENPSPAGGIYQFFLLLIMSLAFVWALRQVMAGVPEVRIRDAFYQGMYPLIPVLLVMLVVCLQLVPMIIGTTLFATFVTGGIATTPIEIVMWTIGSLLFASISVYLLISSLFAFYIAALPDMTPIKALRSARDLVRYRRWSVLRKLILLPILLFVTSIIIMMPIILFATIVAPWAFFVMLMIGLPLIHAYMYTLYRELLV